MKKLLPLTLLFLILFSCKKETEADKENQDYLGPKSALYETIWKPVYVKTNGVDLSSSIIPTSYIRFYKPTEEYQLEGYSEYGYIFLKYTIYTDNVINYSDFINYYPELSQIHLAGTGEWEYVFGFDLQFAREYQITKLTDTELHLIALDTPTEVEIHFAN